MGFYIDPPDMDKEVWLAAYADLLPDVPRTHYDEATDRVAVCLVGNGSFNAAGIAFSKMELHRFVEGLDGRPALWFYVKRERVLPFLHGKAIESCQA